MSPSFAGNSLEFTTVSVKPRKIEIIPIAFESFGVRSMCTFIQTPDVQVLVDPGISLGQRFGLLPHPREYEARERCRKQLAEIAGKADVVTISHYHFDHFTPGYVDTVWNGSSPEIALEIYEGKDLLAKDIRSHITYSQRRRGWILQKLFRERVNAFHAADGKAFEFGETILRFSDPVFHGPEGSKLGWVLMLIVERAGEKVLHASDVQGPLADSTLRLILEEKPDVLIVGGPPLYLVSFRASEASVKLSLENLKEVARKVPIIILDHHLLRDQKWPHFRDEVVKEGRRYGCKVVTAAEYLGMESKPLEF